MPQSEGYIRWPSNANIPLVLTLADETGAAIIGATPEVSIRRLRKTHGNEELPKDFWEGAWFTPTPTWIVMEELDPVSSPGTYTYLFQQAIVGLEYIYGVYYRHIAPPSGFALELHMITNEVFVPTTVPDPITFGPNTVMGQLELIKDGGTGQFDIAKDNLHAFSQNILRTMGLLHHNAIVDKHTYDTNGQLASARLRVFDSAAKVPSTPGGNEVNGLLFEYTFAAAYTGLGIQTLWKGTTQ